jgi:intracellular multiplication protein IcmE
MSEEIPLPENQGFEVEVGDAESSIGMGRQPMAPKHDKRAERAANIKHTFGQGPGRIAMILVAIVLAVFLMIGIRSCSHKSDVAKSDASIDVPGAPAATVSTKPVTPEEMKRHAEVSQKEAAEAHAAGKDYQTSFDPVIAKNKQSTTLNGNAPSASFDVDGVDTTSARPKAPAAATAGQGAPQGLVPIGGVAPSSNGVSDAAAHGYDGHDGAAPADNSAQTPEQQKAQQDAEKAHMDAFHKAVADRDQWVDKTRDRVISQAEEILGVGNQNQIKYSGYRAFTYARDTSDAPPSPDGSAVGGSATSSDGKSSKLDEAGTAKGPPLIKTGNSLYITTNSVVNTDHGGQLFGTVRGGTWSGAQVICNIDQAPDNIRAHCTTLAPQDSRPTMKIDGVLLRESDMAQGIAESVNHHTISRYTALAVASLFQGYGEAYSYQQGTAVVTANGTVLQTNEAPSNKQVIGRALGQMGTNAGGEIQKGFNRPATYSTPANQGMVLYFLSDVYAPSAAQQ